VHFVSHPWGADDKLTEPQDYWRSSTTSRRPGEEAVSVAHQRAQGFVEKYGHCYPKAVDCLLDNLTALSAHLHFPVGHRERVRHSNLLERTFSETRRRVRVIGRLPGEHSCLSLVCAVLYPASVGWREINTSGGPASDDVRICDASCSDLPSCAPIASSSRPAPKS
jgi:transposase-like protein